jgi:hypothetical protein
MKIEAVTPQYVDELPDELEEGVFYICEAFDLTAHRCCCGCGENVFNKLNPAKWRLEKMSDGTVSLFPSVGNWKYACKSHYWIRANQVIDAGAMNVRTIEAVQERDRRDRDRYIATVNARPAPQPATIWARLRARIARVLDRIRLLWPW